jgi:hypothetical protein
VIHKISTVNTSVRLRRRSCTEPNHSKPFNHTDFSRKAQSKCDSLLPHMHPVEAQFDDRCSFGVFVCLFVCLLVFLFLVR